MNEDLTEYLRCRDPRFISLVSDRTRLATSFMDVLRLSVLRKKAIRAGFWPSAPSESRLRLAVVGGSTLSPFSELLEHHLEAQGEHCQLFIGDFDNYISEILEIDGPLRAFNPNVTVILPSNPRCISAAPLSAPIEVHQASVQGNVDENLHLCRTLHEVTGCEIILANYLLPHRMDPGSFRTKTLGSPWSFRKRVNLELGLQAPSYVQICDVEFLGCRIGNQNAADDRAWFESKQAFAPDMTELVAREVAHLVMALRRSTKKVLVMDLDNTLWGGVIGDDGLEGIELGDTTSRGEAFKAFQKFAKSLCNRGILLAVCSKNEETTAMEPFEKHPEMVIRLEDIVAFKANWRPKSENIIEMASELNLGLDSFVFVDDNPAEVEIVRQFAPEVECIHLGSDPSTFVGLLEESRLFEPRSLTAEDVDRVPIYKQEAARKRLLNSVADMGTYLKSLEMVAHVERFNAVDVPRISQLINKSNQFNLTTRRRTEGEVLALIGDQSMPGFSVRLADRFGDHGLIAVVIPRVLGEELHIDTWLMSCRVLKRRIEDLVLNELMALAKEYGCKNVRGQFIPSQKNAMVKNLFSEMGFEKILEQTDGNAEYKLDVSDYRERDIAIRVTRGTNG